MLRNAKHEAFAQAVAIGQNFTQAYVTAGYKVQHNSAQQNGARLAKLPEIIARVDAIRGPAAVQAGVTAERLINMGVELYNAAKLAEDFTAASATLQRIAVIAGYWVDRTESKANQTIRLVSDRPAQAMDESTWLAQHAPQALN